MCRFIKVLFLLIILGLCNNANGQTHKLLEPHEIDSINFYYPPLYLNDSMDMQHLLDFQYINVYYFNGECSLCINKMLEAETFFQEQKKDYLKTVFIVETSDTIVFNYYRDKLEITTKTLWDRNYRLNNHNINTCYLIDKSGNIIIEGDFIEDKNEQKKYIEIINNLISDD